MKRIKLIILPLIICAFITGCNKAQINNEDKQTNNKSAQTSKANDNKENKKETADVSQTNEKRKLVMSLYRLQIKIIKSLQIPIAKMITQ